MAVTYEAIAKANASIVPMEMKRQNKKTGEVVVKGYAEVNQRVKAFRMVHPMGMIDTSDFSIEGEYGKRVARCRAIIRDDEGHIIATGTAEEKEGSTQINSTSFIENCETSAVGRALGFCGFGIDTSLASYEEVANAINQQEGKPNEEIPAEQIAKAREQMFKKDEPSKPCDALTPKQIEWIIKNFNLAKKEDITQEHIDKAMAYAKEKKNVK